MIKGARVTHKLSGVTGTVISIKGGVLRIKRDPEYYEYSTGGLLRKTFVIKSWVSYQKNWRECGA